MQQAFTDSIVKNINRHSAALKSEFDRDRDPVRSRFAVLDNVLPEADASRIHEAAMLLLVTSVAGLLFGQRGLYRS